MPALWPPLVSTKVTSVSVSEVDLVDRAPGRDVVRFGADHEHRHADVGQRDRPAVRPRYRPSARSLLRNRRRRYSLCMR